MLGRHESTALRDRVPRQPTDPPREFAPARESPGERIARDKETSFMNRYAEERLRLLAATAGVQIADSPSHPWDICVHNPRFYRRAWFDGTLGAGESYMDGDWDCDQLDELAARMTRGGLRERLTKGPANWTLEVATRLRNEGRRSRAFLVGEKHYDIGNDLYSAMLGHTMMYTCAYWQGAVTLDEAQTAKLERVCRKLELREGMRVLDIGCGWSGFGYYAARRYGVSVVGLTVSKEQATFGRRICEGLPVEVILQDYRDFHPGPAFDRIVSLGMFEHVCSKNYGEFAAVMRRCLRSDGLALLGTIGSNVSETMGDAWIHRYIFPVGHVPSLAQIGRALEGKFVLEDLENFGASYDPTIVAWYRNFRAAWNQLRHRYSERFRRMWEYYLLTAAGSFRARNGQVWHFVLSPAGIPGGYHPFR